jgi:hypothetical protein
MIMFFAYLDFYTTMVNKYQTFLSTGGDDNRVEFWKDQLGYYTSKLNEFNN